MYLMIVKKGMNNFVSKMFRAFYTLLMYDVDNQI